MSGRALLVLSSRQIREKAIDWIMRLPPGTRVEFKEPQRTLEQNDRMWAMLTDIARQCTLNGRRWSTDQWKVIFLHELGREAQFIPSLTGSFIPYGQSSSDLGVKEMSDLIESMFAYGAENGVRWSDPKLQENAA
ncbi:recombination protein NinB [Bradyrhizobium quebecense]|uniref:Recombination protein NinB n=1 Tax=Bradyrhizobium quebecense TaxID=2748629 RepID=A0A973WMZ4_9BRAD|nr:recombination protein NinB [Bradyrhizobium quebecense]UGA46630.1 recombination protein NinB [Bradyrhizobium quebecense]